MAQNFGKISARVTSSAKTFNKHLEGPLPASSVGVLYQKRKKIEEEKNIASKHLRNLALSRPKSTMMDSGRSILPQIFQRVPSSSAYRIRSIKPPPNVSEVSANVFMKSRKPAFSSNAAAIVPRYFVVRERSSSATSMKTAERISEHEYIGKKHVMYTQPSRMPGFMSNVKRFKTT